MGPIALTVDLEPDWGVRGTRAFREITPRFLRFLRERDIRATFFVVSDLLDASSEPVAGIAECDEVASHGRSHHLLTRLARREVLQNLRESRERLSEFGRPVRGFRAPFFMRCRGLRAILRSAGYAYDASRGSVVPGPVNGRLHRMGSPTVRDGFGEFSTSAMCRGLVPLSLTWLRLLAPFSFSGLPRSASLLYLHLHEFLPPETASCLPLPMRRVLTRNCGRKAWEILDRALEELGGRFTTCARVLETRLGGTGAERNTDD